MNSRSPTHPSCQQLSLPSIQLNCSDTWHTRSATHLLCHGQRSHGRCQFLATRLPLVRDAHALDPSTLRNGDISFCTLRVPSTRVRRSVLHWAQEEGLAPSAPSPRHHRHRLALDRALLLDLLDLDSLVLRVRTRPATLPILNLGQWHRISFVSSRFHVDVVHIVLFVRSRTTVRL